MLTRDVLPTTQLADTRLCCSPAVSSVLNGMRRAQPCLLTTLFAAGVVAYNLLTCTCAAPLVQQGY